MLNSHEISIKQLAIHYIGSKSQEEGVILSRVPLNLYDETVTSLLHKYFFTSFRTEEYFHFSQESGAPENMLFQSINRIFGNPSALMGESMIIANLLYEMSAHPKIKTGELYVAYLENCLVDGEITDAIGLFKSESKDAFLQVTSSGENFEISSQKGVNVNKLDKGCVVFNLEKEQGYVLEIVDNVNKNSEAQYWKTDFLRVKPRKDEYQQTKHYLDLCKTFVLEKAPAEFEISKADQADFLNKSATYFKNNEEFGFESFADEVIHQPDVIESFKGYKKEYERERDMEIPDEFMISPSAVKSNSKVFKSVIKLDKNFHVYIHGNRDHIVKGFDEKTGMHYYQLFFKEEQ